MANVREAASAAPAIDLLSPSSFAHGQPHEMYRWYRPGTAGYPLDPSEVIRPWNRYTGRWNELPLLNPRPGP